MSKTAKKTTKLRKGRTTHPHVMSFRLTATQAKLMGEIIQREPATHVKSANQMGRKIVADFLAGRLEYKNKEDRLRDLEPVGR